MKYIILMQVTGALIGSGIGLIAASIALYLIN